MIDKPIEWHACLTSQLQNIQTEAIPEVPFWGNTKMSQWTGFASAHPTAVNFAFADGTVHLVPRTTPWETLYALYGENDGSKDLKLDF